MRPPEFTGGNLDMARVRALQAETASMRPPEFTGGNLPAATISRPPRAQLQ